MNITTYTNPIYYGGLLDDTSSLVGPACDGILEWLTNLFDLQSFFSSFFEDAGFGKSVINGYFSTDTLNSIRSTSIFISAIIAICLFALHLVLVNMNFASDSSQKQTMIDLLIRMPITFLLILGIPSIITVIDNIVDEILNQAFFTPTFSELLSDAGTLMSTDKIVSNMISMTATAAFSTIIILVLFIAIIIEVVKLLIEIAERNIVLWVMDIFAPMAASTYVSRTTNGIFVNFLRMYASQSILVILNQFFLVIFYRLCVNVTELLHLKYLILILAVLKTAQRIDSHLKTMGLTVAQTGSMLLDSIGMSIAGVTAMIRGSRTAMGAAGSVLAAKGAANGDMGMAILGNNLSSFARGDFANMGHEMGMNRAQMRGIFKNTGLGNAASIQEAVTEAKTGNFRPINQLNPEVKTQALKNAFGSDGINSILKQTGLDLNNAKNMTINPMNGDVSGIVSVKDSNGNMKDVAFRTSSTPLNSSSKQINGISGECYITPMNNKVAPGFRASGTQLMSTMSNVDLSAAESSGLHITESEYCEYNGRGYISHYDDDTIVGLTDAKTAEFYSMGTMYTDPNNSDPFVSLDDIASQNDKGEYTVIKSDGLLGGYDFGDDAKILSGSFTQNKNNPEEYDCKVNSNSGTYDVRFTTPVFSANTLVSDRQKVHVTHMGQDRGDIVCSVRKAP